MEVKNKKVVVNDTMQKGYTYELSARMGKDFDPAFKPDLTPKQLLALGIFGGVYMRDCTKEFPKEWFTKAKFAKGDTLCRPRQRQALLHWAYDTRKL